MATTLTTSRSDPAQIHPLAQRLKAWRSTRIRGQRIPEELWKAAVDLARVHGLHPTAAALKLNYYGLQRRLLGDHVPRKRRVIPAPFVELVPPAMPCGLDERGTVEMVQASGARLTLRLPHASAKDLLALVHLFLRHRS
jgi:hypothetical protein